MRRSVDEPLTKRRPSGSSARQRTELVWCVKVQDVAVDDEELDFRPRGERVLVVGKRQDSTQLVRSLNVFLRAPSKSHTWTVRRVAAQDALPSGVTASA